MTTTQTLFEQIDVLYNKFKEEHHKSTKIAHKNARALLMDIKKLVTPYNSASVQEDKEKKG